MSDKPPYEEMSPEWLLWEIFSGGIGPLSEVTDRIDLIDQMLFDAGVMVLSAKTGAQRKAADRKIMDARVELDKLRSRFE